MRRRRGGVLVGVLIVALVAAVGLVWADRAARAKAEHQVAVALQERLRTAELPSVTMAGTPFLQQVAERRYRDVQLRAVGITGTPVPLAELQVHLDDVRTDERLTQAVAASLAGTARVAWGDVGALAKGLPVTWAPHDRVRVQYTAQVWGIDVPVDVTAKPSLDIASQTIVLREPEAVVAKVNLPKDLVDQLLASQVKPVPLPLPGSLQATGLQAREDGLVLQVIGSDVDLTRLA